MLMKHTVFVDTLAFFQLVDELWFYPLLLLLHLLRNTYAIELHGLKPPLAVYAAPKFHPNLQIPKKVVEKYVKKPDLKHSLIAIIS